MMKFSKHCNAKYKPAYFVEDMKGNQISDYYNTFGEALSKAREKSCFTRGGCRINVCMASFHVEGGRIIAEV